MSRKVEFIYDQDCPNVGAARAALMEAFSISGVIPKWQEWDRNSDASPKYARDFGSPTILVDGQDIAGGSASGANSCRVYTVNGQLTGIPAVGLIAEKLSPNVIKKRSFGGAFAAFPAIGIAVLPKLTCAACWPAYAALMSSIGVGFFNYTDYLLPITLTALAVSLFALGVTALRSKSYRVFSLGIVAAALIFVGKFWFESDPITYTGAAILIGASIWSALLRTKFSSPKCPSCPQ